MLEEKKLHEHAMNIPTYHYTKYIGKNAPKSPWRMLKFKIANYLMDGILQKHIVWFNELLKILNINNYEEQWWSKNAVSTNTDNSKITPS